MNSTMGAAHTPPAWQAMPRTSCLELHHVDPDMRGGPSTAET
jgi:hypothetical protein